MENPKMHVTDVSLVEWNVRGPFRVGTNEEIGLNINSGFELKSEENVVQVHIKVDFHYPDSKDVSVISSKVVTSFYFDLDKSQDDIAKLDIHDQYFITMLSVSISHARSIILQQSKSLGLQGFIIPLVNPTEIYNRIKDNAGKKVDS